MIVLALEASTSAAKAALYSVENGLLGTLGIPYSSDICDTVTIDPEGAFQAVTDCGRLLLEKLKISEVDIIGLSSIWSHSILMLDEDRQPMGRISTWANTDCAGTVSRYKKDAELNRRFYRKTGCPIHSIYTLWKWMHFRESAGAGQGRKVFISTLPEFIFEKLTNRPAVSKTVASAGGMLNIHSLEWDDEILKFAGISAEMLSPLREPEFTEPLGARAAGLLGLKPGIPVVVAGADGALNQIAAGGLKKGIMTISVGTSGALRLSNDKPVLPDKPSTWCYYGAEGKRIVGAATSGAGNCVEWLARKVFSGTKTMKELDLGLEGGDFQNAPIFLPFLFGERCPGWEDTRQGGFCGLTGSHKDTDLYFSVLEGVLFNLFQCYKTLNDIMDEPEYISISGGIEHSGAWLQMAADIFGKEIHTSDVRDASLLGAVKVALKVTGILKSLQEIDPGAGDKYTPDYLKSSIYKERYERYIKCYDTMK